MDYLSINYWIVYAFLAITLIIGLRAGRNIKNIREYAIANKSFGTGALLLTLLATNTAGASLIHGIDRIFSQGIIMLIALLGVSVFFLITGFFIAPKAARFDHCLTMGDLMKEFYGKYSGMLAGFLGTLNASLLIGMELHILGMICESLLGVPAKWGIVTGGIVLSIYSAYGGIKAVTMTDIFQFIMLAIFIPLIAYIAIGKVGGILSLLQQVPAKKLAVFSHQDFSLYLTLLLIWSIPAALIDPALIQRLLMAKPGKKARYPYFLAAAFDPVFQLVIMLIALSAVVLYPHIEGKQVISQLIYGLLPNGLQGLAIAGVLAVGMSTIDSYLHAAGLTLARDVIKPIYDRKNKTINEIKWARYMTVVMGVIGIGIGIKADDILGLSFSALEFVSPLLMFPLLSGIMGLKTDARSFYTALVVTLVAFIIAKWSLPESYAHISVLVTMAANGLTFFGMHVIQHKGFAIQKPDGQAKIWRPKKQDLWSLLKSLLPTPKRIMQYSQNKVATYGAPYILFGVFILINYTLPYFIWMQTPAQYEIPMLYLRVIGGILCVLLIFREKWADWLLPLFPSFWHVTVMYALPFTSTVMFLLTGASVEWVVNIFGIIILLLVLLDWLTALIVSIVGISIGIAFYKLIAGNGYVPVSFNTQYLMVYQGIFGILIGLLFARRRQRHFDELATEHQSLAVTHQEDKNLLMETFKEKVRLLKALQNAGIQDLPKAIKLIKNMRKAEEKAIHDVPNLADFFQQLDQTLTPIAVALERIENRATDYLRLNIESITIEALLGGLQEQFPKLPLAYQLHTKQQQLVCDAKRIQKLLVNTLDIIQATVKDHPTIYIDLQDTQLTYPIRSIGQAYTKHIDAMGIHISTRSTNKGLDISYPAQMNQTSLPISESPHEIAWVHNQRIVKAHYGYTNVDISQQTKYEYYLYIIPVDINEIRPRDMNDPYMELGAELVRANDQYPGAEAQESALLKAIQEKKTANLETIKLALEMIKWYHGPKNRHSGEPFYLHPVAVAQIVIAWKPDEAAILGALLHDIVEDTAMLLENIEMIFGPEVVKIVDGVTHFESTAESFYKIKLSSHENILMLLEVEDPRTLYVKIADRLHNLRTIEGHRSLDKQQQIAEETLQFYVPLAQALNLDAAVAELKARSVAILNAYRPTNNTSD